MNAQRQPHQRVERALRRCRDRSRQQPAGTAAAVSSAAARSGLPCSPAFFRSRASDARHFAIIAARDRNQEGATNRAAPARAVRSARNARPRAPGGSRRPTAITISPRNRAVSQPGNDRTSVTASLPRNCRLSDAHARDRTRSRRCTVATRRWRARRAQATAARMPRLTRRG